MNEFNYSPLCIETIQPSSCQEPSSFHLNNNSLNSLRLIFFDAKCFKPIIIRILELQFFHRITAVYPSNSIKMIGLQLKDFDSLNKQNV
mmetsp:Transcript_19134/g.26135  ORF Transcript_19134/g.26135 Transcript_19134/m.26135 type:complete len:89 (-) Transcript_19134:273-539(-)